MLGITFLSSIPPTQRLVFLSPVCCLPNARDYVSIKHPTHPTTCGHISSLPPTLCSGSRFYQASLPPNDLCSYLQFAAYLMLGITFLSSIPPTQRLVFLSPACHLPMLGITFLSSIPPTPRLVVISPACRLPNCRDQATFEHATHSNSSYHIASSPPTQCSGSRFF